MAQRECEIARYDQPAFHCQTIRLLIRIGLNSSDATMPHRGQTMSISIEAVYEAGILKPLTPLTELAEHSRVRVTSEATDIFKQARADGVLSPYVKLIPIDDEPIWTPSRGSLYLLRPYFVRASAYRRTATIGPYFVRASTYSGDIFIR